MINRPLFYIIAISAVFIVSAASYAHDGNIKPHSSVI